MADTPITTTLVAVDNRDGSEHVLGTWSGVDAAAFIAAHSYFGDPTYSDREGFPDGQEQLSAFDLDRIAYNCLEAGEDGAFRHLNFPALTENEARHHVATLTVAVHTARTQLAAGDHVAIYVRTPEDAWLGRRCWRPVTVDGRLDVEEIP